MADVLTSDFGLRYVCFVLVLQVPFIISQSTVGGTKVPGVSPQWHTPVGWSISPKGDQADNTSSASDKTSSGTGTDDVITPTLSARYDRPGTSPQPLVSQKSVVFSTPTVNFTDGRPHGSVNETARVLHKEGLPTQVPGNSTRRVPVLPTSFVSVKPSRNLEQNRDISNQGSSPEHTLQQGVQRNDLLFRTGYFQDLATTSSPNPENSTHNKQTLTTSIETRNNVRGTPETFSNEVQGTSKTFTDAEQGTSETFADAVLGTFKTFTDAEQGTSETFADAVLGTSKTFTDAERGTSETFADAVLGTSKTFTSADEGTSKTFTDAEQDTSKTSTSGLKDNDRAFTNAVDVRATKSTISDRDMVSFLTGVDLDTAAEREDGSPRSTNFPEVDRSTDSRLDHQKTNSGWGFVAPTSGEVVDPSNKERNISDTGQQGESTKGENGPPSEMVITKLVDPIERGELSDNSLFQAGEGDSDAADVNVSRNDYLSQQGKYDGEYGTASEYEELDALYDMNNFTYEDLFGNETGGIDYYTEEGSMDNTTQTAEDDCLYDVSGASGRLSFPDEEHFPVFETKEFLTCRWRVRVPDGPNVRVTFERLALSLGVENLEIAVGMDGELKKRTYTGSKVPHDLVTKGTRLWLTAHVRNDNYDGKIVLSFAETSDEGMFPVKENYTCGAILSDLRGNISSPGYPHTNYSSNQECSWYLVAPSQSVIRLTVKEFKTDVYDHVTMGIGLHAGATNSKLLTLFGRLQEQRETVIPSNSLWIHFTSDDSDTDKGFFISYQVIPRDICNGSNVLTAPEGTVTSPGYPAMYAINSECTWYIRAPPTSYVNITFHDLSLQDGRDFVLIGEGSDLFGGPFDTYTGNKTSPRPILVETRSVWIHFTSDHLEGDLPYRGFSLTYHIVDKKAAGKKVLLEEERKDEEDNMVLQDNSLPFNDEGRRQVIKIPLTGVTAEQLDNKLDEFKTCLVELLNKRCANGEKGKCGTDRPLRPEEVRVVSRRQDERRLVVAVSLETERPVTVPAMASTDYEELEQLFHSDLQSLDLQDEESSDHVSSHLPEWLIGVIVVVILLIVAFFAMVIYSLMKERKKSRAGSYGGTTSTASVCEDLESGKTDGNIRITAFSIDNDKDADTTATASNANGHAKDASNGAAWTLDSEAASTLQRRQPGVSGCMNPAFIDDDAEKEEEEEEEEEKKKREEETKKKKDKEEAKNTKEVAKNTKSEAKNAKEETKNAKEEAKNAKDGKRSKSPKPSQAKSPKSPKKAKSPKSSSKAAKSASKSNNEETTQVANGDSTTGKSVENGSAVKHAPAAEPKDGTVDAVIEEEAKDKDNTQHHHEDAKTDDVADSGTNAEEPQPSTSGGEAGSDLASSSHPGSGRLEVVVDRELIQPQNQLVMQVDKDDSQRDQEHQFESSTDEKEDNTDMSTNL